MFEAALFGNLAFIQFYLENGGNINVQDETSGKTCLHFACKFDCSETVNFLLMSGINAEVKDKENEQTPMFVCIQNRSMMSLKILIKHGCNINAQE